MHQTTFLVHSLNLLPNMEREKLLGYVVKIKDQ